VIPQNIVDERWKAELEQGPRHSAKQVSSIREIKRV
jgi:hypothetical protein